MNALLIKVLPGSFCRQFNAWRNQYRWLWLNNNNMKYNNNQTVERPAVASFLYTTVRATKA